MLIDNNGLPDIISSLEKDDFVYLHPNKQEDLAYFGRYIGVKSAKMTSSVG